MESLLPAADTPAPPAKHPVKLWMVIATIPVGLLSGDAGYFIPDRLILYWGCAAAAGIGVAAAISIAVMMRKEVAAKPYLIVMLLFLMAVFLFLGGFFSVRVLTMGAPDGYTMLIGKPTVRSITVVRWYPGGKSCAHVTIAEIPDLLGHLCLRKQVAPGTIMAVHGRETALGVHVDSIE